MKIAINPGHTISGKGTGASGILSEVNENRKIGKRVMELLRNNGVDVIDTTINTSNNDLKEAVDISNKNSADLFCSIHLNSGGGKGTETYVYKLGGMAEKIAKRVNENVVKSCGFYNRGIKEANFYVLKYTKAPAILVEVCFIDSYDDCQKLNTEKVAIAIAEGLIDKNIIITNDTNQGYNAKVINVNTYLNVRSKPNGEVIGKLFNGESVKAFETQDGFIRVKYDTASGKLSKEGWCSKQYIKLNSDDIYRVRKSWDDAKSQIGAFNSLDNARKCADKNFGYSVFNSLGEKII